MTDHPITRSPDHPILSPLQLFILTTILRHGPQSDMALWYTAPKCESLRAVIVEAGKLAEENFIERTPRHKIPQGHPASVRSKAVQYWQLTQKGQERIIAALGAADDAACNANAQQQEVRLG